MFETLRRAFRLPELRKRILFTLGMFIVIRLGTYIPVPGIDRAAVAELVGQGGFLGLLDLFSGGGIANFAIFSLSVLPYINASIIIELLGSVIPALEELRKEGGKEGQLKIAKYTRYLMLGLAIIESFGVVAIISELSFEHRILREALDCPESHGRILHSALAGRSHDGTWYW